MHLLGALLTTTMAQAALSRADVPSAQIGLGGADALLALPNHTAWARLLSNGVPTSPIRLSLYDAPRAHPPNARPMIEISRDRFGRPRTKIEKRIRRFLSM